MDLVVWNSRDYELVQLERDICLTPVESLYYCSISSPVRRKEWLMSRRMVRATLGDDVSTIYAGRRPALVGSDKHISISHSDNFVVLMVSDTPCGVDIENSERDFSRVQNRFMSKKELSTISEIDIAWGVKEAAFKMLGVADIDFATMFEIKKIDRLNGLSVMSYNGIDYELSIQSFGVYNIVFSSL